MAEAGDLSDVLYQIERMVLRTWMREPSMIDLEVADVFDALARRYALETRGQSTKSPRLTPKAERLYEAVLELSEAQAGRRSSPAEETDVPFRTDVQPSELATSFKRLSRSVATWSERGGRQGYLEYISQFLSG